MQDLIINIENWAKDKALIPGNPRMQYLKILEEIGETAKAVLKNDKDEIKDGIGDILVTVIIYSRQINNKIEDYHMFESIPKELELDIIFNSLFLYIESSNWFALCGALSSLTYKYNLELGECLEAAWNEIKDRKGKTINGTFIKQSDLK